MLGQELQIGIFLIGSLLPSQETILVITNVLVLLSIIFCVMMVLWIVGYRLYLIRTQKKYDAIVEQTTEWLTEFIIMAEDMTDEELVRSLIETSDKFRAEYIRTSLGRRAIKEVMMDMNRHVRGKVADALHALYESLNLDDQALEKLSYGLYHEQAAAIYELTVMQTAHALPQIESYRNSKDEPVRLMAQLGEMKLNPTHPIAFLDGLKTHMNDWHQVNLYAELSKLPKENIPSFRPYLMSDNPSVLLFAIRMIKQFNQLDLQSAVLLKALHPDIHVRKEVWRFIRFFQIAPAVELVDYLLPSNEHEVRLEMIECLGSLMDQSAEDLLIKIIDENLYDLRVEAALALQNAGFEVAQRWPELSYQYEELKAQVQA